MKKRLFILLLLIAAVPLFAVSPKRGKERLRELAVMPSVPLKLGFQIDPLTSIAEINDSATDSERIDLLRQEIKSNEEDIGRQLALGKLLSRGGDTNAAKICFQKAEKLSRTKAELNPADGPLLSQLGDALWWLNKVAEAENVCRKATRVSSKEWRCWTQLGDLLDSRASKLVSPSGGRDPLTLARLIVQGSDGFRVSKESIDTAEKLLHEANEDFDRAVQLAPKDAEALLQRALHYTSSEVTDTLIRIHRKEIENTRKIWTLLTPEKAVPDIKLAASLVDAPSLIAVAASCEWMNTAGVSEQPLSLDSMPDTTRRNIYQAMSRLEGYSQRSDKKIAAPAYESLAMLKVIMNSGDHKQGVNDFLKAVELDPSRNQAWDALSVSAEPAQAVLICERRLKHKDSARNRFLLAKAFSKQEQWEKAVAQAEIALQRQPDYIDAHLLQLAINIRQSSDPKMLEAAANRLMKMNSVFKQPPKSEDAEDPLKLWWLNGAIYHALVDDIDEAKRGIEAVFKKYPEDETAKEIQQNLQ